MPRIWFIAVALSAIALWSTDADALDAAKIDRIAKAADTFAILAKEATKTGRPPRQNEPAAKPLLDLVLDVSDLQGGAARQLADVETLNMWQVSVMKIGTVYLFAGTGMAGNAPLPTDPKLIERVDQNTAAFAPEIGRYADAQLWIQAAVIDTLNGFLATARKNEIDQVRNPVAQIRLGVAQSVTGLIGMFVNTGLSDDWRRGRMPALATIGTKAATFLLPEDARLLRETALEVAVEMSDPSVKAFLSAFAATLATR